MAKSARGPSAHDETIKAFAQQLGLSRKALKKAVQEATVRLAAERIAREHLDSTWQEVANLAKQQQPQPKRKGE
jgi:hypothetical protein